MHNGAQIRGFRLAHRSGGILEGDCCGLDRRINVGSELSLYWDRSGLMETPVPGFAK
jgi:hypothetical protein